MKLLDKRTKKLQARVYPSIPPQERFQLVIKAVAKGDEEEADRLAESCPRKNYRMRDASFIARVEAANTLTLGFALEMAERHGRLEMVKALEEFADYLLDKLTFQAVLDMESAYQLGWRHAGGKGEPPGIAEKVQLPDKKHPLADIRQALEGQVKTLWEAFATVCRQDMGLEPEALLAAFYPPVLSQVEDDLTEEATVDEGTKDEVLTVMREYWQKRTGEL